MYTSIRKPRLTKQEKQAAKDRSDAILAASRAIVATGACPTCGAKIRRNGSMTGWYQCSHLGAVGFRADASKPSCSWQTFTE